MLDFNLVTYSLDTIMNYFFLTQCHKFFAKVVESVYKRTESFIKIPHHAHTNFSKIIWAVEDVLLADLKYFDRKREKDFI